MLRPPVSNPFRLTSTPWIIVLLLALGFGVWTTLVRVQRVEYATGLATEELKLDATSLTGYEGGARKLIVPEHNNDSYHWIAQTQQMVARGEWRVRWVDYDNAPFGREVATASPYRWWLGFVARFDRAIFGTPPRVSVERAALWADPLLLLLLLIGATIFVAWQFGGFPAALFSAGAATLFPFGGGFIPGAPDDTGLSLAGAVWSLLPLLAGFRALRETQGVGPSELACARRRATRWFFVAGVTGGFALWVSVSTQAPIIVGIFLGGLIAAWTGRSDAAKKLSVASTQSSSKKKIGAKTESASAVKVSTVIAESSAISSAQSQEELVADAQATGQSSAWIAWGLGGAVTVLAVYLIEYYPAHLASWQFRAIHPLYGVAWLGLAALVAQAGGWICRRKISAGWLDWVVIVLAVAAVAALPIVMWKLKNAGFLARSVSALRLTKLPNSAVAIDLWTWLLHEGFTARVWATLLPSLLIFPAGWLIFHRRTPVLTRELVALSLGPVLIAVGFAGWRIHEWSMFDATWLGLLVAIAVIPREAIRSQSARWVLPGFSAAVFSLGFAQLAPSVDRGVHRELEKAELDGLIERDLARWLTKHVGVAGAVVLAPPKETTTLYYYGGLRGLGTLAWENKDGLGVAIRILSASTPEEAKELIDRRGVTHLIIPSWDSYLADYARIGMGQIEGTFFNRLLFWKLPPWLRPLVYQLPTIAGFEGQSVMVLEVVEDQEDSVALSRLAEYFVEVGKLDLAGSVAQSLRRFPADLGALVARAQVENALGDAAALAKTVELIRPRLVGNGDRALLWERRTSLAVILVRSKQVDLAKVQVQRCLAEVDEAKLRSLSAGALYRLQVLGKAFGLTITDPALRELARNLLPDDLRRRL